MKKRRKGSTQKQDARAMARAVWLGFITWIAGALAVHFAPFIQ